MFYSKHKPLSKAERILLMVFRQFDFTDLTMNDIRTININFSCLYLTVESLVKRGLILVVNPECNAHAELKYRLTYAGLTYPLKSNESGSIIE